MTRRERLEARAELRREWAEKRRKKAEAGFNRARVIADGIPFGQPILVGHHSERHHRRDIARIDLGMRQGCESADMAEHHDSKAANLERALDRSIYSDDPDAIEALKAKIYGMECERERMRSINAAWRKAGKPAPDDMGGGAWDKVETLSAAPVDVIRAARLDFARNLSWGQKQPFPAYQMQNLGGNITRCRKRITDIEARQARSVEAKQAGGCSIKRTPINDGTGRDWVCITFAEKPEHGVILALKDSGFYWSGGSWHGYSDKLVLVKEWLPELIP